MLSNDTRSEIDNYVNDVCSRDFIVMKSVSQIKNIFGESLEKFLLSLSEADELNLRTWSGFRYVDINAVLRGNWNYELNGLLTTEKTNEFRQLSSMLSNLISKFSTPELDFITFRGTTIDSFASYGISELSQLENLVGKYLYEQGFTSTSMLEDTSYFNKKLDDGRFCNVGIRYLIPAESNDGALLIDSDMSYSTGQNEFLINTGSLSKVVDVTVDNDSNVAVLTVVLVPKQIYDKIKMDSKKM